MPSLYTRAINAYRTGGPREFAARGCEFLATVLRDGEPVSEDILEQKRELNRKSEEQFLNVGGSPEFLKEGWRNLNKISSKYDYHSELIDYNIDLEAETEWPIPDDHFKLVYSEATLEHLTFDAVEHTLSEMYRVAKPDGGVRIVVPDVDVATRVYEKDDREWMWKLKPINPDSPWMRPCPDGYEMEYFLVRWIASVLNTIDHNQGVEYADVRRDYEKMDRTEFLDHYAELAQREGVEGYPQCHRNWFNAEKLTEQLTEVGFVDINQTQARRSRWPELCQDGFDTRPAWSVHVEGRKPAASEE